MTATKSKAKKIVKHYAATREITVKDGTYAPDPQAVRDAKAAQGSGLIPLRPTDRGYRHPVGPARTTTRHIWVCVCGKTSGKCTYPDAKLALRAGIRHSLDAKQHRSDFDAKTGTLSDEADKEIRAMIAQLQHPRNGNVGEHYRMLPGLRHHPRSMRPEWIETALAKRQAEAKAS